VEKLKELVFYPGSWFYNALVYGFLRVLEKNELPVEEFLKDDGVVEFSCDVIKDLSTPPEEDKISEFIVKEVKLLESYENDIKNGNLRKSDKKKRLSKIEGWRSYIDTLNPLLKTMPKLLFYYVRAFHKLKNKSAIISFNQVFKTNRHFFPNLFASSKPKFHDYFNATIEKMTKWFSGYLDLWCLTNPDSGISDVCHLCGETIALGEKMQKIAKEVFNEKGKIEKAKRLFTFSPELFGENVVSWSSQFPNRYWDAKASDFVCQRCSILGIFRYFSLGDQRAFFINAPSFKVIWYLNEVLNFMQNKNNSSPQNLLTLALLESPVKLAALLGGWARQNLEIISYNEKDVSFYFLSSHTIDALLDAEVTYVLKKTESSIKSEPINNREIKDRLPPIDSPEDFPQACVSEA